MAQINITGDIISNDDKWIYDWLEWDSTCPKDVKDILAAAEKDEAVDVIINSGGGSVLAGQEIYSALKDDPRATVEVQSLAGSAASVIAMAAPCRMSPVAMMMIHNVSMSGASGDYHDMKKNSEILQRMNEALASAYTEKTGKSQDEILHLMDKETWLTANQCLEMGFADEVMKAQPVMSNSYTGMRLTDEIRKKVLAEKAKQDKDTETKNQLLKDLDAYGV